jgi:hypothetical protein
MNPAAIRNTLASTKFEDLRVGHLRCYRGIYGMYEMKCIAAPKFLSDTNMLSGHMCYFIEPYDPTKILSVAVKTLQEEYVLKVLDNMGHHIQFDDLPAPFTEFMSQKMLELLCVVRTVGLDACQLFFAVSGNDVLLVDLFDGHKFAGPGMLKDIFSKRFNLQKIIKIDKLEPGEEVHDFIIKPSTFMAVEKDG